MNKRFVGLILGATLAVGIAIGDTAEPVIKTFTDHVIVSLDEDTPMQEAVVTVPSLEGMTTTARGWKEEYHGLIEQDTSVSFTNVPSTGVVVTVHLGKEVPSFVGDGLASITSVRVVYGNDVITDRPPRGVNNGEMLSDRPPRLVIPRPPVVRNPTHPR